jgi:D-alanyl-lipoteichoic acid acyltransferase DltB (MBOAT superfamily)
MQFHTVTFWLFFALVAGLYFRLPHRGQNRLLLVASYVFYGWWDWRFLALIAVSTLVDFVAGLRIAASGRPVVRRAWLCASISTNLGLLGVFKYYNFFAGELAALLAWIGLPTSLHSLNILLPVGISFYTFQTLSYTIDVYRGQTQPTRHLLDFGLFVSFFPQLVAGPIERSGRLLPQILQPRQVGADDFRAGLHDVLAGLYRKVVIADNMALIADAVFAQPARDLSGAEALIGVYAFAFQIYGDFSGYSLIAKGVARWLGFRLMDNFNAPYLATSPSDFWRRWHISLSSWLRDYLYIPLGGNRGSPAGTHRNLLVTMLLGGLWHGANWTFIAWGAVHGALLCVYKAMAGRVRLPRVRLVTTALAVLVMFHLVCLTWLLFRAESLAQATGMAARMATALHWTPFAVSALLFIVFFVLPLLVVDGHIVKRGRPDSLLAVAWPARATVYSYWLLMLVFFQPAQSHAFIYFQF